ncbi:hypoxanthine phosphoribosyltransferase [Algoriphagus confluentis]|uniref:Hypoxanthine phosphoribosyltransferase n=1 Tax=Algoriphagus confluentis TaxID=1697556 RepID=A0ABQ6PUA7_9BACT|nr:hypoxanthine phosphoribosyltransferase [Algoriphagus confluentis]
MKKRIKDKDFELYLTEDLLKSKLKDLGEKITHDFQGEDLLVLAVLNGSFMVMADLVRSIDLPLECEFLRISSYTGMESSGEVRTVLGLTSELAGKSVLIVEDIVDTGVSMDFLLKELQNRQPKRLAIATLLFKKEAFRFNYSLDYVGFEIPNKFVVGFGLDFDGLGRNLPDLYQLSLS